MARSKGPPAYAWDWFARQRLLWRQVRARLTHATSPVADRYGPTETKSEVLTLLRADYPRDGHVRQAVHHVVGEVAFLGRTDVPFERLGVRTAPRGMRWWWAALTGEEAQPEPTSPPTRRVQLSLDDVHEGYGG